MSIFGTPKALSKFSERIRELEDTCADLQRARRTLDLEFTELYDKVSHQMGRMAKRFTARAATEVIEGEEITPQMFLNSVDPISAKILARRNRTGSPE